ncbi:type IV toxin-antitoxin system AbiEi family antitoxin domain-containing protein [Piscirickettsia litoralis]|uniref:AbiEi antitoxin C-terminal domain-containing protein n=1 Tax=Piscirickettsia litoralis TaxID=1891921 RepID=A0ABX3A0Q5_9GAMM|nr:type IV toxin-antitoxin system AbiEi family antitoxin [Piscirickettsia litoralis]ODN41271.1 hypothetical protein BGC07_17020 [Piscirickettsia litoralis]
MNFSEYMKFTRQKGNRFFTIRQVQEDLGLPYAAIKSAINRQKQHGNLISPAKGLYVIVPPEYQPNGSIPAEQLVPILMKYLQSDYYVSLLSGALYYGATHQKPSRFQIITNKRIRHPLKFGKVIIEVIYKKSLNGLPLLDKNVTTGYLKLGSPELIAIDLLKYSVKSGGLNHIATVLSELVESMDAIKLINIAKITGEKSYLQRLGYILEQIDTFENEKKDAIVTALENYLNQQTASFTPLAPEIPRKGYPRNKKWMLILNTNIESDL